MIAIKLDILVSHLIVPVKTSHHPAVIKLISVLYPIDDVIKTLQILKKNSQCKAMKLFTL